MPVMALAISYYSFLNMSVSPACGEWWQGTQGMSFFINYYQGWPSSKIPAFWNGLFAPLCKSLGEKLAV